MSEPAAERRFVVLRHHPGPAFTRSSEVHFDWMFERGGQLLTWSTVPSDLTELNEREWRCVPLAPHRLHYLDYEGAVSGDRGTVERVISGVYLPRDTGDSDLTASLHWEASDGPRSAEVKIYRSLDCASDASAEEIRTSLTLRFSPG